MGHAPAAAHAHVRAAEALQAQQPDEAAVHPRKALDFYQRVQAPPMILRSKAVLAASTALALLLAV